MHVAHERNRSAEARATELEEVKREAPQASLGARPAVPVRAPSDTRPGYRSHVASALAACQAGCGAAPASRRTATTAEATAPTHTATNTA
jgi:hypothetical protein